MCRWLGISLGLMLCLTVSATATTEVVPEAVLAAKYNRQGQKGIGICLKARPDNAESLRTAFAAFCDVPVADVKLVEDDEDCALGLGLTVELPAGPGMSFSDTWPLEELRGALREAGLTSINVAILLPTSPALESGGVQALSFAGGTRYEAILDLDNPLPTWTISYGWRPIDFILHGLFLLAPMAVIGVLVSLLRIHARRVSTPDRPAAVRVAAFVHTHIALGFMVFWPFYVSIWSSLTWLLYLPGMGLLPGVALMVVLPALASMVVVAWLRAALYPLLCLPHEGRWTRAELWRQGAVIGLASWIPWIVYTAPVFLDLMDLPNDLAWSLAVFGCFGGVAAMIAFNVILPIWINSRAGAVVRPILAGPVRQIYDAHCFAFEKPPVPELYIETWNRGPVAAGLTLPGGLIEKVRAMRPSVRLNSRYVRLADEREFAMAVTRQASSLSLGGLVAIGPFVPIMVVAIGIVPAAFAGMTDAQGTDFLGDPVFVLGWLACILGTALLCAFHRAWCTRRVSVRAEARLLEQFNDPETQIRSLLLEARCAAHPMAWPAWCRLFLPRAPLEVARYVALKGGLDEDDIASALEEVDHIVSTKDVITYEDGAGTSRSPLVALGAVRLACFSSLAVLVVGACLIDTRLLTKPLPLVLFIPVTALILSILGLAVANRAHGWISARMAARLGGVEADAEAPLFSAIVGTSDANPLTRDAMLLDIEEAVLKFRNGEQEIIVAVDNIEAIRLVRSPEVFPHYAVEIVCLDPVIGHSRTWHVLPIGSRTIHQNNLDAARWALQLHGWFVGLTGDDSPAPTTITLSPLKTRLWGMLGTTVALLALGACMRINTPELFDPATEAFRYGALGVCMLFTIWCFGRLYRRWFETQGARQANERNDKPDDSGLSH